MYLKTFFYDWKVKWYDCHCILRISRHMIHIIPIFITAFSKLPVSFIETWWHTGCHSCTWHEKQDSECCCFASLDSLCTGMWRNEKREFGCVMHYCNFTFLCFLKYAACQKPLYINDVIEGQGLLGQFFSILRSDKERCV